MSQAEFQTIIDVLEVVSRNSEIDLPNKITTGDLKKIMGGLKEFKDLASKVKPPPAAYTLRPETK